MTAPPEYQKQDPFELVNTPWGHMERWRSDAIAVGTIGALRNVHDAVRSDVATQVARADAAKAQEALIRHVCDSVDNFQRRFDAFQRRYAEAEEQRARDDAAKRKFDEEPIDLPPDLREHQALKPAAPIRDDEPPSAGKSKEPEPSLELSDGEGELPEPLEPIAANYPNQEPSKPPVVEQPVAISLNEE